MRLHGRFYARSARISRVAPAENRWLWYNTFTERKFDSAPLYADRNTICPTLIPSFPRIVLP